MDKPFPTLPQSEQLPERGAKAAVLAKNGILSGVIASWSAHGAVVESCDGAAVGEKVRLRVQGADKIWKQNATVLWVNGHSFGLEFEPDERVRRGSPNVVPRLRQLLSSLSSPTKEEIPHSVKVKEKRSELQLPDSGDIQDRRSYRRLRFETGAQVQWLNSAMEQDIARITDASRSGVLLTTNRAYPVGTKLQVQYPYPNSASPKRQGNVVRVEMLPNGRRRVAVAFA